MSTEAHPEDSPREASASAGRGRWKTLVGLAVSLLFLALLIRKIELREVLEELRNVDVAILSLSLLTKFASFLLTAQRSRILFRPLHEFAFLRLLRSVFLGFAFNNLLPLRMGELARVEYLARGSGLKRSNCLAVVATEKLLDTFCLALLVAAVIPLTPVQIPVLGQALMVIAVLGGGFGTILLASRSPRRLLDPVEAILKRVHGRLASFVDSQLGGLLEGLAGLRSFRAASAVVTLAFFYWLSSLIGIRIWMAALGLDLPWYAPIVVLAFIAFGVALPSSPGYVGTYHYFAAAAMTTLGVEPAKAVTFAVVGHFMAQVPFTVLAAPLLLSEKRRSSS